MLKKAKIEKKDLVIATSLAFIVFLTLFLASYFNATSGEAINPKATDLEDKYYLSGPDPYYNMRVVKKEFETGHYPYWNKDNPDPLLNYPIGKANSRPPLFNTLFVILAKFLSLFMSDIDAIGLSMQFLPSLYGALLVIPVYLIATLLFNRKVGLLAALMIPLIPIHLGSGHGSAYSLADHDSFILLLGTTLYFFVLKSLHENELKKSMIFAGIAGVFLGMEVLSWAGAYFYFAFLALYFVLLMFVDIVRYNANLKNFLTAVITMFVGLALAFPSYLAKGYIHSITLFSSIAVMLFGSIYIFLSKKKLPWLITVPSIIGLAVIALGALYLVKDSTNPALYPLARFANHIFGGLAYVQKSKVYLTIAEASTFGISRTIMSFGPALYLIAWAGFLYLIIWKRLVRKWDGVSLFITVWFIVEVYLTGSAGRFINDLVPLVAFLSAGAIWSLIDKLNFKQMIRSLRNVRDFRGLRKAIKISHVLGIIFLAFVVVIPNSFLSLDAAVPSAEKGKMFGKDYQGAFGLGLHTEKYWEDAFKWIRQQDREIKEEEKRPAFISWWDYGFYCVAMGEHPTVADNFQSGIEAAGNFHTAQSEKEAIAVLAVRLAEGDMAKHDGKLSEGVKAIFDKYLGNNSTKLVDILEDPIHHRGTSNSSYGKIIGEKYGGEKYRVREKNAMYHDAVKLLTDLLDEEQMVMLYRDLQLKTGWSIRYYGVEGYDVNIFNVFTFLSDKGVFGYETDEDDYFKLYYVSSLSGKFFTLDEIKSIYENYSREDIEMLYGNFIEYIDRKEPFYNSMVYKVYFGNTPPALFKLMVNWTLNVGQRRIILREFTDPINILLSQYKPENKFAVPISFYQPTYGLKHFVIRYLSPLNLSRSLHFHRGDLCYGMPAVVIAKYYEGAKINGTVTCMNKPMPYLFAIVRDDFKQVLQIKTKNMTTGKTEIINRTIEKTPHDYTFTDTNGNFSLIAPAGNITISIEVAVDQYHRYKLKEITFNSTTDPELYPISEEEAMRMPGVDYNRTINITIDPANLKGIIFDDINGNGSYEKGVDQPLSNVEIRLRNRLTGESYTLFTNSSGYYNISDIFPGIYEIKAYYQTFEIHNKSILFLAPGENYYNITKPKPSGVEGIVYYDKDNNGSYDKGEEMEGVNVKIIYSRTNLTVATTITNETGYYKFTDLVPGEYKLNATLVNSTTGNLAYVADVDVLLEENETTKVDILLNLAKIKLSGYTTYNGSYLDNVSIDFTPSKDVKDNTAQFEFTKSNETGYFEVYLTPGVYNISAYKYEFVNQTNESIYYSYEGRIEIEIAQSPVTNYDIALTKKK